MKNKKTQRRLLLFSLAFLLAVVGVDFEIWRVFWYNPWQLGVHYQTISDERIPQSLSNVSIIYFTDLEYGEYIHEGHLEKLSEKIEQLTPDIVLFGGDLFAADFTLDAAAIDTVTTFFSSINAPLGKFAVYGEQDLISEARINYVNSIYLDAQIEVLVNNNRLIANQSREGIHLVGLNTDPDLDQAFIGVGSSTYNLLISHYPDNLVTTSQSAQAVDLALAGNAHGTQITWPVLGGYKEWPGSIELNRGHYVDLDFDYLLSSGIGCIEINARFNAKPDLFYFLIA